jgi:hypothetical protein
MTYRTFTIVVDKWDFSDGTYEYVPTAREARDLARPFVVQASDLEEAMGIISDRTGWCIMQCHEIKYT